MACSVTLAAIAKHCGNNIPGGKSLYIINQDDITAIPAVDVGTRTISTDFTLEVGAFWSEQKFVKSALIHTETGLGNGLFDGALNCEFQKDDDAKRRLFQDLNGHYVSLLYADGNGLVKFIPEALCTPDFTTGQAGQDKNAWTAKFTYQDESAKIYTGAIPTS